MKTTRIYLQAALAGLLLVCTGCASIVTSGDRTIPVNSAPSGANVTVYDMNKKVVASAVTPAQIKLKKGAGYFKGAQYRVLVEKDGYQPCEYQIKPDINGWYWGNFGFGGMLGLVVVDPLTGAMWVLKPDKIEAQLSVCPPGASTAALSSDAKVEHAALKQKAPEPGSGSK